ncbi:basic leucine zipper 43-like [Impatiens glandulifera]|uniref:basic leucine zipper 43-like n=1 Tax=Impatiens glandulifera TaxID=253017 RepID=UPI001FB10823|nr:basic leucine zipper 43-like [Impatiens glandulifera]
MIPSEVAEINYLVSSDNFMISPCPFPSTNMTAPLHFSSFLGGNFPIGQAASPPLHGYNSTSDEADEQQTYVVDERKQRRMISNRESARRSRMRKQKHLDELCSQVMRLRMENQSLVNKLNHVAECHEKIQKENVRLKEETSGLRQMISDIRIGSPFSLLVGDLDDVNCNTAHLRAESSNQSMTASSSFLH